MTDEELLNECVSIEKKFKERNCTDGVMNSYYSHQKFMKYALKHLDEELFEGTMGTYSLNGRYNKEYIAELKREYGVK